MLVADPEIRAAVGDVAFERGRRYAERGDVLKTVWNARELVLIGQVQGSAPWPYTTVVELARHGSTLDVARSSCTCPVRVLCKHAAAVLLAPERAPEHGAAPAVPSWQSSLDRALDAGGSVRSRARGSALALLVELTTDRDDRVRLRARPVSRSAAGRWVKSGISWDVVNRRHHYGLDATHAAALASVYRAAHDDVPWASAPTTIWLDQGGPALWPALVGLVDAGVELTSDVPVTLSSEPAGIEVDLRSADEGALEMAVHVRVGGLDLDPERLLLIGRDAASGVCWWDDAVAVRRPGRALRGQEPHPAQLVLAPFVPAASDAATALLRDVGRLRVPADESARFLRTYYPRLVAHARVGSSDGSVTPPALPAPTLQLRLEAEPGHVVTATWAWEYREADGVVAHRFGIHEATSGWRDAAAEAVITADVQAVAGPLLDGSGSLADARVVAWQAVELVEQVVPSLRGVRGLEVLVDEAVPAYRQAAGEAAVEILTESKDRDWFDLTVRVVVSGVEVPVPALLRAFALGETRVLLPDGLWLQVDTPALARLRALVEESRALEDKHSDSVRVGRLQAGMWAELEDLGIVVAQAAQWQEAVAQVRALEEPLPDTPVPTSVRAELRPYQQSGFAWLARLADAGLGGILADDMGLGKTLQVLSLAAHLRAAGRPPLLVVAPTSVVGAWAGEAATFLPDLRVVTVDRTAARRGHPLAEAVAGADVVVTSYALFRIEHDEYDAQEWSALVLDEAQMVKNHESRAYACARTLRAPVKFAVTGTPLENTVMELWALLGIVAPGLFPSQKRFVEHFRLPIERAGDSERLAQLRRLIRPVVLRRTKESVASELPPRVETVVDVELAPKHRSVYDRQLQRERQKVLGLLADFDGNRFEIFRSLTLLRRLALDPSLVDDAHAGVPASKLDVLESMLAEIVADGHRVLVFSQFTGVLDRVRSRLTEGGTAFAYLDGRTRGRPAVIESFRSGSAPVFLISLKAGGFGLTLTEADYVVVLDPWWNPAVEAQAVDRAHRIGQTRTVMVYRLVAKGTIEEKVMALKAEKAALFDSVMGGGELSDSRMGADDVRALLGV